MPRTVAATTWTLEDGYCYLSANTGLLYGVFQTVSACYVDFMPLDYFPRFPDTAVAWAVELANSTSRMLLTAPSLFLTKRLAAVYIATYAHTLG